MDNQVYKEVYFGAYCKKCEHKKVADHESPCNECLNEPLNWNSHKPVKFEEKIKHERSE
jgi:hypothetical protein